MKSLFTIGRDPQSDIVINDSTDIVSRLHATIRIEGSKMFLIDQSQNGTYVNGMRMSANEEIPVSREDVISFANVCELDWSLLPDPRKDMFRKLTIIASVILVVLLAIVAVLYFTGYWNNPEPSVPSVSIEEPIPADQPESDNKIIEDNTSSEINSEEKRSSKKAEPAPEEPQQEESKKEEPEEPEPVIPLY